MRSLGQTWLRFSGVLFRRFPWRYVPRQSEVVRVMTVRRARLTRFTDRSCWRMSLLPASLLLVWKKARTFDHHQFSMNKS